MKLRYSILPLLFLAHSASGQLAVRTGAQFFVSGNVHLTLRNIDLINDGILGLPNNITTFTGDASSSIKGTGEVRFFQLEVNKTGNSSVFLQNNINVVDRVLFVSGFLDLNGFDIDLGTTGRVDFEREDSRVTGSAGGYLVFTTNLNSPVTANPGGLGLFITSDQNLGTVIIKRGHQSQVNSTGSGNSILRYFDVVAQNNAGLNVTLGVNYFHRELNGLDEKSLEWWQSADNIHWKKDGFTSRDVVNNFVSKTGITSFGRFTLSSSNNPLPLRFIAFTANCNGSNVFIAWTTEQEQKSSRFSVEKSADGNRWIVIGTVPATGSRPSQNSYSFSDNANTQNSFYRVAEYDVDGKVQYTNTVSVSCGLTDRFRVWPNPVKETLSIHINVHMESQVIINLFDSKGALVKVQNANIFRGDNIVNVDMRALVNGIYHLLLVTDHGKTQKSIHIVKQ